METASPGRRRLTARGGRLPRQSTKATPARAGGQRRTPRAARCEPGPGQAASHPTNPLLRQKAGRNPALPVRCWSKPSAGRMLGGLGRCWELGVLLLRAFPAQVGAGCKPLHIPSSGGRADSSTLENKARFGPRTQNKISRPSAFLRLKGKRDGKIERNPARAGTVTAGVKLPFNLIFRSCSGAF